MRKEECTACTARVSSPVMTEQQPHHDRAPVPMTTPAVRWSRDGGEMIDKNSLVNGIKMDLRRGCRAVAVQSCVCHGCSAALLQPLLLLLLLLTVLRCPFLLHLPPHASSLARLSSSSRCCRVLMMYQMCQSGCRIELSSQKPTSMSVKSGHFICMSERERAERAVEELSQQRVMSKKVGREVMDGGDRKRKQEERVQVNWGSRTQGKRRQREMYRALRELLYNERSGQPASLGLPP